MLIASVVLLIAVTILFTLSIRTKDVPPPDPVSPTRHLEERKAAIYENLRDLQFEFRVGKLSDEDYQQTKLGLQKELAGVLAEIDKTVGGAPKVAARAAVAPKPAAAVVTDPAPGTAAKVCPHCGASFPKAMKFCGECGKAMV
ncbi:MAG TPA: zinc ribbon domain-containing protein [Bryobacteraceae bacterium]|nr:zinc ribbon domain-containing protein [Bryobacteraceae bacterium]